MRYYHGCYKSVNSWYTGSVKISYGMAYENASDKNGFGYAGKKMVETLEALRHTVTFCDPTAQIEIWFAQPQQIRWSGCDYRIIYMPWESTLLKPGWLEIMNDCDEVWTPSPVTAQWFEEAGIKVPIFVYEHGVDFGWKFAEREVEDTFQVFHHGAESIRKGFNEAAYIYRGAFAGTDAEMNFKCQITGWNYPMPGINMITGKLPIEELVSLYQRMHLMIYPSWGEGFGLTPLQAMATGMPVLITKGWAPYEHMLPPECLIESELVDSPWPEVHPGKMFKPNIEDGIEKAISLHENYHYQLAIAKEISLDLPGKYSWTIKTKQILSHFEGTKLF